MPSSLSDEESGARTVFAASERFPSRGEGKKGASDSAVGVAEGSDGVVGSGAYRIGYDGEMVKTGKQYVQMRKDGWGQKIVDHTLRAFEVIESGKVFTE